jgi:hypothetical protein
MEQSKFFLWTSRVTSILFLLLIAIVIGFTIYGIFESKKWGGRNTVEVVGEQLDDEVIEDLRLSNITKVCGKDVQYVKLDSTNSSKGFSSGGYGSLTRNVVFFVGTDMDSHWLFDTNKYLINEIDQLKKKADDCKDRETVSIYYEVIKSDTNKDGDLNSEDDVTISLTSPDGKNYIELDSGVTSVIDHSIDHDAQVLTMLMQKGSSILMKKYSLESSQLISEKEVSRIGKKL